MLSLIHLSCLWFCFLCVCSFTVHAVVNSPKLFVVLLSAFVLSLCMLSLIHLSCLWFCFLCVCSFTVHAVVNSPKLFVVLLSAFVLSLCIIHLIGLSADSPDYTLGCFRYLYTIFFTVAALTVVLALLDSASLAILLFLISVIWGKQFLDVFFSLRRADLITTSPVALDACRVNVQVA